MALCWDVHRAPPQCAHDLLLMLQAQLEFARNNSAPECDIDLEDFDLAGEQPAEQTAI